MNLRKSNILIIGGGPAGIEAATQLKRLGYQPVIVEKNDHLGGHLAQWDRLFPNSIPAKPVLDNMLNQLQDVDYQLSCTVEHIKKDGSMFIATLSNGLSVNADAVVVTTGFELFKAERKQEYGYGIYNNVITNAELENYFKTGSDTRINEPKKIGFVHCVGSRDEKVGNTYCSKVCCATALKQACEIKEQFPDSEVYTFYMDLRMFGSGYENLYLKAQQQHDIKCIRGRVCEVSENIDGQLVIKAEDTLLGTPLKMTLDLLVLMCGMDKSADADRIGEMLHIQKDSDGFFKNRDSYLGMNLTDEDGVFVAGSCTYPKTLPDTISEARAVAVEVNNYLNIIK